MSNEPCKQKKRGILGGTFDPIHLGHLAMAEAAITECHLDCVIFVPAGDPPHKKNRHLTSADHRYAMTEMAVRQLDQSFECFVCDYEILKPTPSYTIHLVSHFQQKYPNDHLYLLLGADSLVELETWYQYEKLLRTVRFLIFNRPGISREALQEKIQSYQQQFQAQIHFLDAFHHTVSSTDIRDQLLWMDGDSVSVPAPVMRYIVANNLYEDR